MQGPRVDLVFAWCCPCGVVVLRTHQNARAPRDKSLAKLKVALNQQLHYVSTGAGNAQVRGGTGEEWSTGVRDKGFWG